MGQKKAKRRENKINGGKMVTSPFGLIWRLTLIIFLAELSIMIVLNVVPPVPQFTWPLLDAVLLIFLVFPWLYFLIFLPLTKEVAERKRAEKKLFESKVKIEAVFQGSGVGIRSIDSEFRIIEQNKEMDLLCGIERNEAIGRKCCELFGDSRCGTDKCTLRQILSGKKQVDVEMERFTKNGKVVSVNLIATPLVNEKGEVMGIIESFRDITERKKIEKEKEALTKKLKHQAQTDGLTGVYNRQHLDEELKIEIKRAQRYNRPLSLIMLDIDHFKKVNDRCGHQVGDWALKKIAKSMKDVARATDFVGRYGGEEFIVVCTETAIDKALNLAERMKKEIKGLRVLDKDGLSLGITGSFGVAQYSESEDFDKLLAKVDDALYRAKKEGRDRICCAEV